VIERDEVCDTVKSAVGRLGRGGMSALSPFSPQLRTLAGAVGTAEKRQIRTLKARGHRIEESWLGLCRRFDLARLEGERLANEATQAAGRTDC
jgi:hypothetical protein